MHDSYRWTIDHNKDLGDQTDGRTGVMGIYYLLSIMVHVSGIGYGQERVIVTEVYLNIK